MLKSSLALCIFYLILSLNCFGQQLEFKLFKGDGFEISYPQNWTVGKEDKVYNFYLDKNLGDISISVYKDSDLPSKVVQKLILELNDKRTKSDRVKVEVKQNLREYTYEYSEDGIKWLIKGTQTKKDLFLITLNWNLKDWDSYKESLNKAFSSFKIH